MFSTRIHLDMNVSECTTESVGVTSTLTTSLFQLLLSSYCSISPSTLWPKDYGEEISLDIDSFDFVIVGAGTAGSVLGNRLSFNPNVSVLVVEAGGNPPAESEVTKLFVRINHNVSLPYTTDSLSCVPYATN